MSYSQCADVLRLENPVPVSETSYYPARSSSFKTNVLMMYAKLCLLLLSLIYLVGLKAEPCLDAGLDTFPQYASEGEPMYVTCSLFDKYDASKFVVVWYQNGSQIQFPSDEQLRIHQNEHILKFFPAKLEDRDFYGCILRNSTFCIKQLVQLEVYKNEEGVCYNRDILFPQEEYISHSNKVLCEKLDEYPVVMSQIRWLKDCQPLNFSIRYEILNDSLIIQNATVQDGGIYTCEVPFMFNGTEYTISRTVNYTLQVLASNIFPSSPEMALEPCVEDGFDITTEYASEGEPMYIQCSLLIVYDASEFEFEVAWYKNDFQIQFSSDKQLRIHQNENVLKFFPAKIEDTDSYGCIIRNSTFCVKQLVALKVYKNEEDLCYHSDIVFPENERISKSNKVICPDLDAYPVVLSRIRWLKDCQPLNFNIRYGNVKDNLIIQNATVQDGGIYTCKVPFIYNGTEYTISRTINYTLQAQLANIPPTILNPTNNVVEVTLDANMLPYLTFLILPVLVVIIVILIFKFFKVDIILWYRATCLPKTVIKDGKLYDAYVMYPKSTKDHYNHAMDIFVFRVLPEVLEKRCAYKLFIYGRNDLPGQAITDLIDEAISQSRRLIIVLLNTYGKNRLEDNFEQHLAMYDALIRDKLQVILIELEKITDYSQMPESIKYIKQKKGVVRWKGQFNDVSLSPSTKFWKNIRYRMPPTNKQHF
ncbi:interleukin-1 receptor type 1 isoform X3 [Bombina bombina]|uniref:interleukin-1 receptor type 1 isoform X3 n=1 Tax=Bombina bombina TaxID=8345 RepID=UPI00235A6FC9|nr:interleukin-1 receptor type 1 isoform X3 [Bombina bombina]